MVGSIDPRRETLRAIQWRLDAARLFGTPVAETILASGLPTAQTGRTHGSKRFDPNISSRTLQAGGRPHMDRFAALAMTSAFSASLLAAAASTVDAQSGQRLR